jgi:hypothetical protein
MRILVEELLCQAVMGLILVLECLLSGARGHMWLRLVMPDNKWCCFPRTRLQWRLTSTGKPPGVTARAWIRAELGYEEELPWASKRQNPVRL